MRSSNPVLTRLTPETHTGYPGPPAYAPPAGYSSPGYSPGYSTPGGYPSSVVAGPAADRMTIDDVVVRTVGLLALTAFSGAVAWAIIPNSLMGPAAIGAALVGLVLGLVISFKQVTNPALILTYAVIEGVFVGLVSKWFETIYPGIVIQATIGTFGIFFVMTALYKFRVIRATPKFAKGLVAAMIGVFVLILGNWLLSLFGVYTGLRGDAEGNGGALAIVFSLVIIVIASLTFILDFDLIEQSVLYGAPKQMAWACAFGLLVGLIWVYLEVLRLLSYLRGRE